jgi:hypothetical protein
MARRNGRLSPESNAELETIDLAGAITQKSPKSDAVLAAAEELSRTGFAVTTQAIADRIGEAGTVGVNRVHSRIEVLKRQGRWPFGAPEPSAPRYPATTAITAAAVTSNVSTVAAELDAMKVLAELDSEARSRVLRWAADRFGRS